jgi:hypothetical protein
VVGGRPISFSFHGRLGLRIEADEEAVRQHYAAEYAVHAEDIPDGAPLVRLLSPARSEGLRRQRHKLLARWRSRVSLGEREVLIEARGNRLSIPMVHHMMVHPSLRLLASRGGELLLHAGALSRGGRSLILTGGGGAGKTTVTSLLLEQSGDWQLHGDDYVFLGEGRRTYPYLTRAHLYRSLTNWLPAVRGRLTAGEKLRLGVLGRLREWSGERIKWPVRIPTDRLWPGREVCREAELAAIVLLRKGRADRPQLSRADDNGETFDRLIEMNFHEARHFIRIVWQGDEGAPLLQGWRSQERATIGRLCAGVPVYSLDLPSGGPREDTSGRLVDILDRVIAARV